jgi:hypothetical protein
MSELLRRGTGFVLALAVLLASGFPALAQEADEPDLDEETALEEPALAPPAGAPARRPAPHPLESWGLQRLDLGAAQLFYPPNISEASLGQGAQAARVVLARLPQLFGIEAEPVDMYLFGSKPEYDRAMGALGRAGAGVHSTEAGRHIAGNTRAAGVYFYAAGSQFRTTGSLGHEYVHVIVHALTRNSDVPQWFNEGVAGYVEDEISGEPAAEVARRKLLKDARVANVARQGSLPRLTTLETRPGWRDAVDRDHEVAYATARLAAEQLISLRGYPGVVQTLRAVGDGVAFEEAFRQTFGMGLAQWDDAFLAFIQGTLMARYPGEINAYPQPTQFGEATTLLVFGLGASENFGYELRGPEQCSVGRGRETATASGFAFFGLQVLSPRCTGRWSVTVTGDSGTTRRGSFEIVTEDPSATRRGTRRD